jgi:hypothetical protein
MGQIFNVCSNQSMESKNSNAESENSNAESENSNAESKNSNAESENSNAESENSIKYKAKHLFGYNHRSYDIIKYNDENNNKYCIYVSHDTDYSGGIKSTIYHNNKQVCNIIVDYSDNWSEKLELRESQGYSNIVFEFYR